jgi:general secretion pathway protein H
MAKKAEKTTVKISKAGTLNNKHSAGFTLFELLIVMAIMGMMFGMLVLNINIGSPSGDMKTAIRRISGAVSEARSRALLKRTPLELHFKREGLELFQTIDSKKLKIGSAPLPADVFIEDVEIDGEHGKRVLIFQSKGITQPATISLSTDDEWQIVLIRPIQGIELRDGKRPRKNRLTE